MKKFLMMIISSALVLALVGCSSNPTQGPIKTIEKDYIVKDASSNERATWIADATDWAKSGGDLKQYRYFSFETTPKNDREAACDLAKANARADIAQEIATFIEKSLGFSKEGAASIDENNPQMQALREFVEVTLAEKTKALIHGAQVLKTHWEKRQYKQELGAKRDFFGYTCAVLIQMPSDRLKNAIDEAANHVVQKADDPATKENVKNALKDAAENFDKAKRGEI